MAWVSFPMCGRAHVLQGNESLEVFFFLVIYSFDKRQSHLPMPGVNEQEKKTQL